MSKSFKDSNEHAFRKLVRDAIRRGDFTKHERDIIYAFINLWIHHRNGPKRYIHPNRKSLAIKANCSVKTVSRCLGMLRAAGVITAISSLKAGQGKSVQYTVNLHEFFTLCGMDWVDEFARGRSQNVPLNSGKMSHYKRVGMSHCLNNVTDGGLAKGTFLPISESLIDYDDRGIDWDA